MFRNHTTFPHNGTRPVSYLCIYPFVVNLNDVFGAELDAKTGENSMIDEPKSVRMIVVLFLVGTEIVS